MLRRLALAAALAACLPFAHAALPAPVAAALAANGLPEDALGVIVIRGNTIVLEQNAARPMRPASVMKTVTTMVGLDRLGPAFRGRTELLSNAAVVGGTLQGDLVLRGGADVDLTTATLERMLHDLRSQGIRRIAGNVMVDRSLFTPARLDIGVPPFDESPEAYYNVIPDAAIINRNMLDIDMRSTDKRITFSVWPELDRVAVTSDMTLIDGDCAKWEDGWKQPEYKRDGSGRLKIVLHGTFPKNCARSNSINVLDRQDYTARLFRALWKRQGGQLKGEVVDGVAPADARLLAEHVSRPLPEIVRDVNKPSDNEIARTIFLALGSLQFDEKLGSKPLPVDGVGSTLVRADATVRAWMHEHGISDDGLVLENGSGLSRIERVSPQQLAGVLQAALKSNWAPEFVTSLPIAAVDGTMRRRLKDSPAASHARVKTGTLRDTIANAGYVPDANGEVCIVAAILNDDHVGNGKGRAVLDALLDWVARSSAAGQ
ncbi:D-alanyl-D-alanine carboxypeptidase/D-alanyl-D-alanine-endopeptidase [Massilia arenosa]|uniref:D-alanyl-D-alanine carboxypeptidase/D-alanyl-D-alanine-endopeptidase n=1 Tax=Zemynaea arenosa TaxID=2561931 RepID=A0A4Y9RRT6_9BURK|nr:D-alanyl-D-alanine carboxypeptidase/D-alanyl-D-alanine-endopeptidase [Massilia arenosa]TFW11622.1 D-alanyl-D-alanine carboxypeptidase/D-alanyl-D-alanine-endopeptidase [Massilia arenosa]